VTQLQGHHFATRVNRAQASRSAVMPRRRSAFRDRYCRRL